MTDSPLRKVKKQPFYIGIIICLVVIVVALFSFIYFNDSRLSDTTKDYANWQLSSVEAIEIYDYQSGELITKYDDKNSIDSLITILDVENWEKVGKINDDISAEYTIELYHNTTQQDKNNDIEEITIYGDGGYASIFST